MKALEKEVMDALRKGIGSNDDYWSVEKTPVLLSSPLQGKRFYFLGSSVTIGFASGNEAVADYIAKRNHCLCLKDAISGTTLRQKEKGDDSYVSRLQSGRILRFGEKVDAFICQLSTNDAWEVERYGKILPQGEGKMEDFDPSTTLGAIEYIIAFVRQKFACPIFFYTGSFYQEMNGKNYALLVQYLLQIATEWSIHVIDLFSDPAFNAINPKCYQYFMHDPIHPFKSGYRAWWTPEFEKALSRSLKGKHVFPSSL